MESSEHLAVLWWRCGSVAVVGRKVSLVVVGSS